MMIGFREKLFRFLGVFCCCCFCVSLLITIFFVGGRMAAMFSDGSFFKRYLVTLLKHTFKQIFGDTRQTLMTED